jgi:hypothetical protein
MHAMSLEPKLAAMFAIRAKKDLEPPVRPGGPPDKERARRPPLSTPKRRQRKKPVAHSIPVAS